MGFFLAYCKTRKYGAFSANAPSANNHNAPTNFLIYGISSKLLNDNFSPCLISELCACVISDVRFYLLSCNTGIEVTQVKTIGNRVSTKAWVSSVGLLSSTFNVVPLAPNVTSI